MRPGPFALAGLSMGGYVAFEILRRAPERVLRLALLDTSARPDAPEQSARRRGLIELAQKGRFLGVTPRLLPQLLHPDHARDHAIANTVVQMARAVGREGFVAQQRAIMGRPESSPHRMIHKNRARRRNLAHDVECRARDESRNAPIFEHMGDETDGLMAERSAGHEQRQIDCLVCELIG